MASNTATGVASSDGNNRILISDSECDFILSGCRVDCRLDGRKRLEFRPYQILIPGGGNSNEQATSSDDLLPLSHGSARLMGSVGHTSTEEQQILCSVKAELVHPSALAPNQGVVELHLHGSSGSRHTKRDLEQAQDILSQLLVGRLVDTHALCITPGEFVWRLAVDVFVLEAAGGCLLDCAARVASAALAATRLPQVTAQPKTNPSSSSGSTEAETSEQQQNQNTLVVDGDYAKSQSIPLPTTTLVGANGPSTLSSSIVTVAVMQDFDLATKRPLYSLIVDATLAEEACALALIHVCVQLAHCNDDPKAPPTASIVGLHKTQQGALPIHLLPDITNTALEAAASASLAFSTVQPSRLLEENRQKQPKPNLSTLLQEQLQWVGEET